MKRALEGDIPELKALPGPTIPSLPSFHVKDDITFDLNHFVVPEHYAADLSSVIIPHGFIMDRISKLAVDICRAYEFKEKGTRLHMVKSYHCLSISTSSWPDSLADPTSAYPTVLRCAC